MPFPVTNKSQDAALLILRLIIAASFLQAGLVKWTMWSLTPEASGMPAWLLLSMKILAIAEPLGAVALVAGFLTRWASAGLAVIMAGAILVMQFVMNMGFTTPTGAGWNFPLTMLASCLVLMAFGPGNWSADAPLCRKMGSR